MPGHNYPSMGLAVDLGSIFAPETLLPSQHKDMHRGTAEKAGERRLMLAVLEDAIRVITKPTKKTTLLMVETWEWIKDEDLINPFSFVNVCNYLDIDTDYLRRGLTQGTEQIRLQKRAPVVADVRPLDERLTRCRKQEVA